MSKIYLFVLVSLFHRAVVVAQLEVDTSYSSEDLIKNILLDKKQNFIVNNISYKGANRSIGVFTCNMKYNSFIKKGIIVSTGDVLDARGPNYATNKSTKTNNARDSDLEELSNGKTYDAAVLEFDFTAQGDSLTFNFVFASEEYPEYVNKKVNDVFGFFITDKATGEKINLAVLPNTSIPITVDNINAKENSEFYIENKPWLSRTMTQWGLQRQIAEYAHTFEYDGFTRTIRVTAPIQNGSVYHFKIAIADVGDRLFDSAIFIEANSFRNNKTEKLNPITAVQQAFNIESENPDSIAVNLNIHFDADSARIKDVSSFKLLNKVCKILLSNPNLLLQVNGHTDATGTAEHNLALSESRAFNVVTYLQNKGIDDKRLMYKGFGSSRPISNNENDLNRRVEFVFKVE